MTVSAVVGVFIPVIVLGVTELIVKLCFKSVFEYLADHFLKYGFQVSDILYLHQREQFPQFLSSFLFCCPYLRAVFVPWHNFNLRFVISILYHLGGLHNI